jgi:hypothetical protein
MATVALKMSKLNPAALLVLANRIHEQMSTNAGTFATPYVTMVVLLTQIDGTALAVQNCIGGGKITRAIRKQEVTKLKKMLSDLARYVQSVSDGEETVINLAGMEIKTRGPRKYESINAPEGVVAKLTFTPGVVRVSWKAVRTVTNYEIQWCPDPLTEDGWKKATTSTASRTLVEGLPSGQIVWFRVKGFSAAGESAWSAVTNSRVV